MKRGCWNWWNYKTMFEVVHLKYISTATPYFWCTHKNESPIHTPLNLEVNAVERSTSHHVGRYASDVSPVICHTGSRWIKKYAFRHPHTHTHTPHRRSEATHGGGWTTLDPTHPSKTNLRTSHAPEKELENNWASCTACTLEKQVAHLEPKRKVCVYRDETYKQK